MSNSDGARFVENRPKFLIIRALGYPPDEMFTELLEAARLGASDIKFAAPMDVSNKSIAPKDFDRIFVILTDELALDEYLEACILVVAQCEMGVIGIWGKNVFSNEMHPAVQKYGEQQIPWSPEKLHQVINFNTSRRFQSSVGGPAACHKTKHNRC